MKNTFFFIIIAAVIPACKTSSQEISIIPLTMLKYDTTTTIEGKAFPIKWEFFLVKGYKDNAYCDQYIDSFVHKNSDTGYIASGNSYAMVFYKESKETNVKNIKEMKWKIIDRYSQDHDLIFDYGWKGGLHGKEKIKNGEVSGDRNKPEIQIREIRN